MVSRVGSASTSSVDRLRYRLLPSRSSSKYLSATSTALHAKLHTLITASSVPSARSELRHSSNSPVVWYGAGRHDGGMNLQRGVTDMAQGTHWQRARSHGLIMQRRSLFEMSMRCSLVKLEKVASLVSRA